MEVDPVQHDPTEQEDADRRVDSQFFIKHFLGPLNHTPK